VIYPVSDHEYGRGGRIQDPWGHQWMVFSAVSATALPVPPE